MFTILLTSFAVLLGASCAFALTWMTLRWLVQSAYAWVMSTFFHRTTIGWKSFYDLAPSAPGSRYPFDWMNRRRAVIARAHGFCERCHKDLHNQRKEVHHTRRNSANGVGDHALGHLQLLCFECHAKEPGHGLVLLRR